MPRPELPDAVEDTTATFETIAGEGAEVRARLPVSGRLNTGDAGVVADPVTEVNALTMGPTPNRPMVRPLKTDSIRPLGVVARCSSSGTSRTVSGGASFLVLDRPRLRDSSSLVSVSPGRDLTALAQEIMSSRLLDEDEEAMTPAMGDTGDCDFFR